MKYIERQIDPRVQQAADEFRQSLDELKEAQDPLLKKVLRTEAMKKLHQAVAVTEAGEMRKDTKLQPVSKN